MVECHCVSLFPFIRPACAYPPVLQPGLQNGPDIYASDRDSFSFGIMGQQGAGCVPNLASSPNGNVYQLSSSVGPNPPGLGSNSGGGGTGGNILSVGPAHVGFSSSAAPTTNSYSQMHMTQQQQLPPYSMATDMIPTGHHLANSSPSQFANQQSYGQMIGPNGEKMLSQQIMSLGRNSGLAYTGSRSSNNTNSPASQQPPGPGPNPQQYGGMVSGPNTNIPPQQAQSQQQQPPPPSRIPPNQMGPGRTCVQTDVVSSRSVGPRSVSGLSDPTTGQCRFITQKLLIFTYLVSVSAFCVGVNHTGIFSFSILFSYLRNLRR